MRANVRPIDLSTGVTLDYVEQGNAAGVPILLLHGLSDSWHSFERVLPHLPGYVRAIAPSLRGHGNSSRPDAGYGYRDFTADIAAFMDITDLSPAVVVAHSLGASIAQRLAIDHPERVQRLVLIGSFASLARSPAPHELWAALSQMDDEVDPDFVREFQASTLARPVPRAFFEMIVRESCRLPTRVWRAILADNMQDDFSTELDCIKAPTLLVWGDQDRVVPRSDQDHQLAAISDARLIVYEDAGHGLHWEEPERFAADLVSFVEEYSKASATLRGTRSKSPAAASTSRS